MLHTVPNIDTASSTASASSTEDGYNHKRAKLDLLLHDNNNSNNVFYHIDQYAMPSPSHHEDDEYDNTTDILRQLPDMIHAYDSLSLEMKSYIMFQLLKRSSTSTLQFVNSMIVPALKRDFLASLPLELALNVISHLDALSLCRAACVSRKWRSVIDSDANTWRRLLDKDGFEYDPVDEDEEDDDDTYSFGSVLDSELGYNDHSMDTGEEEEQQQQQEEEEDQHHDDDEQHANAHIQWRQAWYGADCYPLHGSNSSTTTSRMEIDLDFGSNKSQQQQQQPRRHPNPYKELYRHQYTLQQNWRKGRFKRTRFEGPPPDTVVTCLQFDDDKIITGADDHSINIYDTRTGRRMHTLSGHDGGVWALQYYNNTLVSGSTDRTVRVWDIRKGLCTHVFQGHSSTVRCLQIVQPTLVNGRMEPSVPLIVTGSRDSTLRVWRLPDVERSNETFYGSGVNRWFIHTLTGHEQSVRALAAHGNKLVSGSYDCTVCIWDIQQGRLIHRMGGHVQKVYSVVIDPERQRCMSGSMDSTVRIWDMEHGHCLRVLEGHSILVGLLGITPNYLVSAAADSTLRIWCPETGTCRQVLWGHRGAITCFQHNENAVISGSEGGIKMWDIKTGHLIRDLITGVDGVWRVAFDKRRCVAAVHR